MVVEQKRIIERFIAQLWNNRNLAVIDELCASTYQYHDPSLPSWYAFGRSGLKDLASSVLTAFPDFRVQIEDMVADGELVVTRVTQTGTQTGMLGDLAPTGRTVSVTAFSVERFVDGKIAESWGVSDQLGLREQLGLVSARSPRRRSTSASH